MINSDNHSNNNRSFHLEKYHGISSRHTCPGCGRKRCFTYYVDEQGCVLDKAVGKCDHDSSCGYHYKPKDYFHDHEWESKDYGNFGKRSAIVHKPEPDVLPRFPVYQVLPWVWVQRFKGIRNGLTDYLRLYFEEWDISRVVDDYYIGGTKQHEAVFWQIDIHGSARAGKIIAYESNGHRSKDENKHVGWMHSRLLRQHLIAEGFELHQCLFGEHLIAEYPYRTIFMVEAEKTAIICAMVMPMVTWISCGGKTQLSGERVSFLRQKRVVMLPDIDGMQQWIAKAAEMRDKEKINVKVLTDIYDDATPKQKSHGCDVADLIMDALDAEGRESSVIKRLCTIVTENINE